MPGTALRQKASLYRRVASVPTEGGHNEDRLLRALADQLEREAVESEKHLAGPAEMPLPSITHAASARERGSRAR
jgi:hypothetical protein